MTGQQKTTYILQIQHLNKSFSHVVANDDVSFNLKKGEIHCLLGENGAGKSTLSKCLYGVYKPDSGKIFVKSNPLNLSSPKDAIRTGIGMVSQHFILAPPMNAVENIIVGTQSSGRILNFRQAEKTIRTLCEYYQVEINLKAPVSQLSVREQQWIEILKALYGGLDILILDEPTAVLTPQETEKLFATLRKMTEDGLSIIFITHKLYEVMAVSDRVTVLRKGKVIGTVNTREVSDLDLARMMVGREVDFHLEKKRLEPGELLLELTNLEIAGDNGQDAVRNIDLKIRKKEIVGLAGVGGNGQMELFDAIVGVRKTTQGRIGLKGKEITNLSPREISQRGLASIPPDRIKQGLLMDFSVAENLIFGRQRSPQYRFGFLLNRTEIEKFASASIKAFDIRTSGTDQKADLLSGGNLQKLILARELSGDISCVVASSPTRGLDVGATEFVHRRLLDLRQQGVGILLISEDLDELFSLSDRIAVIFKGQIGGVYDSREVTKEAVGLLMAGVGEDPK